MTEVGAAAGPPFWTRHPWKFVRVAAAVGLLVGLTGVVIVSYLPGALVASCREQLSSTGQLVMVCGPIGTADVVAVGLVLAVAGLLMWPELCEVGVSGLITLKRRVEENQREQRATADAVRNLTLAQEVPDLGAARKELGGRLDRWSHLPDDVRVLPAGVDAPASPPDARTISEQRADAEERLHRVVGEMDDYLRVLSHEHPTRLLRHPSRYRRIRDTDINDYYAALLRWARDYDGPLRDWANVRNTAVLYPERLSEAEVRDTVALGDGLLVALEGYLPPGAQRYGAR